MDNEGELHLTVFVIRLPCTIYLQQRGHMEMILEEYTVTWLLQTYTG